MLSIAYGHYGLCVYNRKFLLSNAMDNTLRQWDVRPFVTGSRQVKVYQGATVRQAHDALPLLWPAFERHPN